MSIPTIPGYDIQRELGQGGFGKVYLGKDKISGGLVAIKFLKDENPKSLNDLVNEIQLIDSFDHPNIVKYRTHIQNGESLCFVMDYCDKGSLYNAMGSASLEKKVEWIITTTKTIAQLHDRGVYHNDLKPGNLLINKSGTLKISDFGCANLSWGTRVFLPPEMLIDQYPSHDDPRRDIYALGVTLLELITGNNPFSGLSNEQIFQKHLAGNIIPEEIPQWLQEVILKAIHRIPELRFQNASDFAEAMSAKHVPSVLNRRKLIAGNISQKITKLITQKKWVKASGLVEEGLQNYHDDVSIFKAAGSYYLNRNQVAKAQQIFLKALSLNPRIDVQKELGICQLELGNYPQAISLINDHLSRSGLDKEAYNSLIRCYYETSRYEYAIQLCDQLLANKDLKFRFLYNNRLICKILMGVREFSEFKNSINPFIAYNLALLQPQSEFYNDDKGPNLKSKLLFQEVRHESLKDDMNRFWLDNLDRNNQREVTKAIATVGRTGYHNDIEFGNTKVSRKHAVIINQKNDLWIYDLNSTGIWVDGIRVKNRAPLLYNTKIEFNGFFGRFIYSLDKVV
ncbi:FHA domain-containing serine/threonine-protein kinase [Cyclobacterium marinum]|uniref:FHA domain-containing serine/threonine-protein kinase n=1 Tax=Cyclobacterium marinum TaxID=104 RepID=UPI0011EE34DB|nr:FHA domain-containing serine/threonine-protein kinase [Cyclobacterium marinum]MBI0401355.1 protein kinase [Cyclobacterium marinum]